MAITVGTNSWATEAEADAYFAQRLGASAYWDSNTDKEAALVTAFRRLRGSNRLSVPLSANATLKEAQCEYALYLIQHLEDEDLRLGLQVQHVVEAGVVKEKYTGNAEVLPIPPTVLALLAGYNTERAGYLFDIERDEEQRTSYDAVGNLDRNTTS